MRFPIVPRFHPEVSDQDRLRADQVAEQVLLEHPHLMDAEKTFKHLQVAQSIGNEPTFHLDDFSETPVIGGYHNSEILQQRARLRAGEGDWLALTRQMDAGFSDYFEYKLGLGRVHWLYPAISPSSSRHLAFECWQDRRLRHDLIQAVRRGGLRYIHPHISTLHVWELADFLSRATRIPVRVIGPNHLLSRWANDKIEFTRTASRLLGPTTVPATDSAYNFSMLSRKVRDLSARHKMLGIKFPAAAGGLGNFVLDGRELRGKSLALVSQHLKQILDVGYWPQSGRVLIDVWEEDVLCSPSVQTWIPPAAQSEPVIEGLFEQSVYGEKRHFEGAFPLVGHPLEQPIIDGSFLLAVVYQKLGCVGRCSFDLIITGTDENNCRIEFIEANARWGGTSAPMTLVNRLPIDQNRRTFAMLRLNHPKLGKLSFAELLRQFEPDLYDPQTGCGRFLFFNPARLQSEASIDAVALGESPASLQETLREGLPARFDQLRVTGSGNELKTFVDE